jgi:hypothetical protein
MAEKQPATPAIPASLDLRDIEALVRFETEMFLKSQSEAQREVAAGFGLGGWEQLVAHFKSRKLVVQPPEARGEPIVFDLCFSRNRAGRALREVGLHIDPYLELERKMFAAMVSPVTVPSRKAEVICPYLLSTYPVRVRVHVVRFGLPTDLRIEVPDRVCGARLREELTALAAKDAPNVEGERRHTALWGEIHKLLERRGVTLNQVRSRQAVLPREALLELIAMGERTPDNLRGNLHSLCSWVGKEDRETAARWLISEFRKPGADSQLGVRIMELAIPAVAEDLIELIQDNRFGDRRGCLCLGLAQTRNKRAAEVIAGVLNEPGVTRWAIEALGKLKAAGFADSVRPFLRDGNADVRGEAKKTLKKMGFLIEAAPAPLHLVKNRSKLPGALAEWSSNLDGEQLQPILQKLGNCVEGFGSAEVGEILGVVEEMKVDQTRTFKFPVAHKGQAVEVWIVIFMDDVDSPDLAIFAKEDLICDLKAAMGEL